MCPARPGWEGKFLFSFNLRLPDPCLVATEPRCRWGPTLVLLGGRVYVCPVCLSYSRTSTVPTLEDQPQTGNSASSLRRTGSPFSASSRLLLLLPRRVIRWRLVCPHSQTHPANAEKSTVDGKSLFCPGSSPALTPSSSNSTGRHSRFLPEAYIS